MLFLVTIKNKIELDQFYALIILVVGKYNPAFMYIWVNSFIENQVYWMYSLNIINLCIH